MSLHGMTPNAPPVEADLARAFDRSNNEFLALGAAALSGFPFTVACWFYALNVTQDFALLSGGDSTAAAQYWIMAAAGSTGGDRIVLQVRNGASNVTANTTTTYVANRWHHAAAVANGSGAIGVYLDGGGKGTAGGATFPSPNNETRIGRIVSTGGTNYLDGRLAWPFIWNIALDDFDIAALAAGTPPWQIQPRAIVAGPLLRTLRDRWARPSAIWSVAGAMPTSWPFADVTHTPVGWDLASIYRNAHIDAADDFDRGDSSSLGSAWAEFNEAGNGLEIDTNRLHCQQDNGRQPSGGTAIHQTAVEGSSIRIAFRAGHDVHPSGLGDIRLIIYARNESASALGSHYRIEMTGEASSGRLYRDDGGGGGAVDLGAVAIELPGADPILHEFEWTIQNLPGLVRHTFRQNGSVRTTIDDTDASRITSRRGYAGVRMVVDLGSLVLGFDEAVRLDDFEGQNIGYPVRLDGTHPALNSVGDDAGPLRLDGLHSVTDAIAITGLRLEGLHEVRSRITPELSGLHTVRNSIGDDAGPLRLEGTHSHGVTVRGRLEGLHSIAVAVSGLRLDGLSRVANTLDPYGLWIGTGAEPDLTAAPDETFSSLPYTTATVFSPSTTYYLVVRERNAYGLWGQNIQSWRLELDASGDEVTYRPGDPDDIAIEATAGGTVEITAVYDHPADGDQAADTWAIWITSDGSTPDPDVDPVTDTTAMVRADARTRLRYAAGPYGDGLTITAVVRARRSSDGVESSNTAAVNTTAETDGPSGPDRIEVVFEGVMSEAQD